MGAVVHGRCRSVGSRSYRARVTLRVEFVSSLKENFTAVKARYYLLRLVLVELAAEAKPKSTSAPAFITYETEITTEKGASGPQERDQQQENGVPRSAGKRSVSTFRLALCSCRIFLTISGVLESSRYSQKSLPEWWGEAGCDVRACRTVGDAKYVVAEGLFETPTHRWMGRSWRTGEINNAF